MTNVQEIVWKAIPGFEGIYEINNIGDVRSTRRQGQWIKNKIRKGAIDRYGYPKITLMKNGKAYYYTIHRLVALVFIPNPENLKCIDHINCIKTDNRVENLEWVTNDENMRRAYKNNLIPNPPGRKINQYNKSGEFIRSFDKIGDVVKSGFSRECARDCALGRQKSHAGFLWKYAELIETQ